MENIRIWFVNAIVIIGAFWGGYQYVETRYAHAGDLEQVRVELHNKIQSDKAYQLRERLWKMEDKYPNIDKGKAPADALESYRRTKAELNDIEKGGK